MDGRPPLAVLSGVRVLSFTQFLLGPSGVQFIADLGADVVKIEPPGGTLWERNWAGSDLYLNGVSAFFLSTHRNQRSLTLDLKHPDGHAVARRLVEGADVLVQNFRPGVMERLGLGWETVRALEPAAGLRLGLRLRRVEPVPRPAGAGSPAPGALRSREHLGPRRAAADARRHGRRRPARRDPPGDGRAGRAPGARAHRPGGPRRGEHAAGGARSPARDRHVLPERRAAREEPDQPREHVPPGPLRLLRDPGRLAGPVDVAAQDAPAGARPARARAVRDGPVQLPGPRGDRPPPRARDEDAHDAGVGRLPGAPRGLGGADPDARRGLRRPGGPGGGRGGGDRPPRRRAGAPPAVPARAVVGAGHRQPAAAHAGRARRRDPARARLPGGGGPAPPRRSGSSDRRRGDERARIVRRAAERR